MGTLVPKEALYLKDTISLLVELAHSAASSRAESGRAPFETGRAFGLMEAVSLLHQQMISFEMQPSSYGFPEEFEPERDLLK